MPINSFFGTWKYSSNAAEIEKLQQSLPLLERYLAKQGLNTFIDTNAFAKDLASGLYFDSTIPTGYGMGSSGALCAAILDTYAFEKEKFSLLALKKLLGEMESFFHGSSSGIDPLVCYLDYPILIDKEIQKVDFLPENKKGKGAIFLLDTLVKRETSPYVNGFLERCQEGIFNKKCETQLVPLVDDAIHSFINGHWSMLFDTMHELSFFQYRYFDFMILENFKEIWLDGLSSSNYKLKICGAGGGGFLLGVSNDFEQTKKTLKKYSIQPVYQF